MTNREKLINEIKNWPRVLEEVTCLVQTSIDEEWEEPYSIPDAFDHMMGLAEENQYDPVARKDLRDCRQILINVGYFREKSPEEIANTYTLGCKAWDFQLHKKKWVADDSWGEWDK